VQGTIEHAVAQVEAFRGVLEHRVVARFDAAVSSGDLGAMSECARIMAEFRQGESQLVQVANSPSLPAHQHTLLLDILLRDPISLHMLPPLSDMGCWGALPRRVRSTAAAPECSALRLMCGWGCLQRYISTRPMFIDVRELSAGTIKSQVTDAATAGIAVRDLAQLFKGLLAAVKEEALIMEQVFPSPRNALLIFVQRVFEQRVQVFPLLSPLITSHACLWLSQL
jgi:hypothetical protein